jgi:2Fe-2S ferredoxin
MMFKVFIPQKNLTLFAEPNANLMDLLIENQIPVASSCLGEGVCSKCAVDMTPRLNPSELEVKTLTRNKRPEDQRLCCQVFITEDIEVKTGYW